MLPFRRGQERKVRPEEPRAALELEIPIFRKMTLLIFIPTTLQTMYSTNWLSCFSRHFTPNNENNNKFTSSSSTRLGKEPAMGTSHSTVQQFRDKKRVSLPRLELLSSNSAASRIAIQSSNRCHSILCEPQVFQQSHGDERYLLWLPAASFCCSIQGNQYRHFSLDFKNIKSIEIEIEWILTSGTAWSQRNESTPYRMHVWIASWDHPSACSSQSSFVEYAN